MRLLEEEKKALVFFERYTNLLTSDLTNLKITEVVKNLLVRLELISSRKNEFSGVWFYQITNKGLLVLKSHL